MCSILRVKSILAPLTPIAVRTLLIEFDYKCFIMTFDLCDSCLIYFGLHVTLILMEIAQFTSVQSIKGKTAFSMKISDLLCIGKGGVASQFNIC